MNKYILVIIICIMPALAGGQDYHPFDMIHSSWNELKTEGGDYGEPTKMIESYQIHGDTIIDSLKYYKLYENTGDQHQYMGCIRESDKIIYYQGIDYFHFETDSVVKLYDFTKNTGDTIHTGTWHWSVIEMIDSIEVDNSYRKRYVMDDGQYWIEGIGSTYGFLYPMTAIPTYSWHSELSCFKISAEIIYLSPNFINCETKKTNSLSKTNIGNLIEVYQDPYHPDHIMIQSKQSSIKHVWLIDIAGKSMKSIHVDRTCLEMNISDLPGRIFLIKIIDHSGNVFSRLLMK